MVGSDGLFEMLSPGIIAAVCGDHIESSNSDKAAKDLCLRAQQAWSKNMIGYIDDITAVVVYFKNTSR